MSKHTIIETQNLTKVYGLGDASVAALNGVSLKIDSGEFVAIKLENKLSVYRLPAVCEGPRATRRK